MKINFMDLGNVFENIADQFKCNSITPGFKNIITIMKGYFFQLVVVVYVMVVLWLVSANFRSSSTTPSSFARARQFFGQVILIK